jgi:hypothetical protein
MLRNIDWGLGRKRQRLVDLLHLLVISCNANNTNKGALL